MKIIYCVLSVYILLTSAVKMLKFSKSMDEFDPNLQYKIPTFFNVSDMISNRANWKTYINYVIKQLQAFPIPGTMSVFARELWLAGVALIDAAHKNKSIYHIEHRYLYLWDDANDLAQAIDVDGNSPMDLSQFQNLLGSLLTNLTNSSIAVTVYRDIVQAADKGMITVFRYPELTEDQFECPMTFIYDPEVLNQFHNATIMGEVANLSDLNIVDNSSDGVTHNDQTPEFRSITTCDGTAYDSAYASNYHDPWLPVNKNYLSMLDDNVSPDRILVASRFSVKYTWIIPTSGIVTAEANDFGTEIVSTIDVGYVDRSGGVSIDTVDAGVLIARADDADLLKDLMALTVSNFLPPVTFNLIGTNQNTTYVCYRDERIVQLDAQGLRKLHTLAQQGLFEYRG